MQILNRHLVSRFLISFFMTLSVFTFVMSVAVVFKVSDFIARGADAKDLMYIFMYQVPDALSYSIPVSVLTATLLLFGQLSSDGEVTAMKACGVSLWQILRGPLLLGLMASVACVYIQSIVAPDFHLKRRILQSELKAKSVLDILEEGRFIRSIPDRRIYVGRINGNRLKDVVIYKLERDRVIQTIRAKWARVNTDEERGLVLINLYEARIDPVRADNQHSGPAYFSQYMFEESLNRFKKRSYNKRNQDKTTGELWSDIKMGAVADFDMDVDDIVKVHSRRLVEFNNRFAVSLSCLTFALLGIPMGIRSNRRDSSIGVGVSILVMFAFYIFIIVAESLSSRPEMFPHLIGWIPVCFGAAFALWRIHRTS